MKTARLCAIGAVAALALAASGPAAGDTASCVGQLASSSGTSDGQAFGAMNSNAAQLDQLHPFGQTSVSTLAQAPRQACPPVGP